METFEYKMLNISRAHLKREKFQVELMEKLNALGAQGWELITIEGLNGYSLVWSQGETVDILFVLKKKVVSPA